MIQPATLLTLTTSPLALSPVAIGGVPAFDLSLAVPGPAALPSVQPLAATGKPLPPVLAVMAGASMATIAIDPATVSIDTASAPILGDLQQPFRTIDPPSPPAGEVPRLASLAQGAVRQPIPVPAARPSTFAPRVLATVATVSPPGPPPLDVAADGEASPLLVGSPFSPASGGEPAAEQATEASKPLSAYGRHGADGAEPEQKAVVGPSEPSPHPQAPAEMRSIVDRAVRHHATPDRSTGENRPEPGVSPASDIPSVDDQPGATPTASPVMVEPTQPDLVPTIAPVAPFAPVAPVAPVVRPGTLETSPFIADTATPAAETVLSKQPTGAAATGPRTLRGAPSQVVSTPLPKVPVRSSSIDRTPERLTLSENDATADIVGETAGSPAYTTAPRLADPAPEPVDPATATPAKPIATIPTTAPPIDQAASSALAIATAASASPAGPSPSRESASTVAAIPLMQAAGPAPVAAKAVFATRAIADTRVPTDPVDATGPRPVSSVAESRVPPDGPISTPNAIAAAASAAAPLPPRPEPFGQITPLAATVPPASPPTPASSPPAATIPAAVPATPSAPDPTGSIQRPVATIAEERLARATLTVPSVALPASGAQPLVAGTSAPAFRVFAEAIHAARADEAERTAPTAPTPIAAIEQPRSALPVSSAQGQSLDMTDHRWPHAMVERIERLQESASATRDAASTSIRLVPDALGTIDVAVRRDGDTVHVHFNAETAQTRALIADAQPRLQELAEAKGIRLAQANVGTGAEGQAQRQPTPQPARIAAAPNGAARDEDTELPTTTRIG